MYNFFNEISTSKMLLRSENYLNPLIAMLETFGKESKDTLTKETKSAFVQNIPLSENDFGEQKQIAIIHLAGTMFKYASWWNNGTDYVAELIAKADADPAIEGIILQINTPGGTTQSVIRLEEVLRNHTKPVVAAIDGQCCSGGIYVASFADRITALNRMCEIGSIGVLSTSVVLKKYMEKLGIDEKYHYPPESEYKNRAYRDIYEKDDDKYLIENELTPYAVHFQNIIKQNRPKLKADTEGILEGKVFYAYDAVENGLIDGILNFNQTIELIIKLAQERKELSTFFS